MNLSRLLGLTHTCVIVRGLQQPPASSELEGFGFDSQPVTNLILMTGTNAPPPMVRHYLYRLELSLPVPAKCRLSRCLWSVGDSSESAYDFMSEIESLNSSLNMGDCQVEFWRSFNRGSCKTLVYQDVSDHDPFFLQELAKVQALLPKLAGDVEFGDQWDTTTLLEPEKLKPEELEGVLAMFHRRLGGLLAQYNWEMAKMLGIPYYKPPGS